MHLIDKFKTFIYRRTDVNYSSGLYVRVDILLTCGKHVHDCIMSLRFEAHITSLTPPLFIEVAVPHMEVSCHVFAC